MHSSRVSLQDCLNIAQPKPITSPEVVISKQESPSSQFLLAYEGGFLSPIVGGEYFKCSTSVAQKLGLYIVSEWPLKA